MANVKVFDRFGSLVAVALYIILWEFLCRVFAVSKDVLPTPTRILRELISNFPLYISHTWLTCKVIASGLAAALLLAPPLAYAVYKWKWFDQLLTPLVVLSQVIPKPALVPLFIVWFSFSNVPNYLITFLFSFYPIFADTRFGLSHTNESHLKMMRVWKATNWQILRTIELPSILPFILSSTKIASVFAVIGAITSEILLSKEGLGYVIQFAAVVGNMDKVFGGIVFAGALGMIIYVFAEFIERKGQVHG